jgi:hypothetical protein
MTTTTNTIASNLNSLAWSLTGFLQMHGSGAKREVRQSIECMVEMAKMSATGLLLDGSITADDLLHAADVCKTISANAWTERDYPTEALARRSGSIMQQVAERMTQEEVA